MKILIHIVEDDLAIRESLKLLLETRGLDVELFASGQDLFARADGKPCDCIILDVNLPDQTGFDVLEKLREKGSHAPAIFMSGRSSAAIRARAERAGAVAFFDKPVRPSDLLTAISRATTAPT